MSNLPIVALLTAARSPTAPAAPVHTGMGAIPYFEGVTFRVCSMFADSVSVSENRGASWSAVRKAIVYLMDSKKFFGIIRAALSLLKSVYDFPHNPKVRERRLLAFDL
jgi:hypothetical protein